MSKKADVVGVNKEIDNLGRLVIPKELRERFGLQKNVEIVATPEGILLKNPEYKLVRIDSEDSSDISDKPPFIQ